MSTAPASEPRAHGRASSPMRALQPLGDTSDAGAPAASARDAVAEAAAATVDSISPETTPAAVLRRGSMSGTDVDEAVERYAALFPGTEFHIERGRRDFSYRYSLFGDQDVTMRSSSIAAEHWGRLPALPDHVVVWWREGSGVIDPGPNEQRSSGSRPVMLPSGRSFGFRFQAGVMNLVHVDAGFLADAASELREGPARPVVFDHMRVPDADASARWRRAVGEASPVLQDADTTPVLRTQAALLVARATLELFPWHDVPLSAELRAPRMAAVRTAIEYLHHHADRPITPADAARAAGISTRVLQLAVRRYEDTTPSALLRTIRLDRVHGELRAASPAATTVRAVAERWGFGHLGRFAASYAERFGELPSTTLRR
jgi:AraC-like DNA-binding protein